MAFRFICKRLWNFTSKRDNFCDLTAECHGCAMIVPS